MFYKVYGISDCPACLHACAELMSNYPQIEFAFINTDFSPAYREKIKEMYQFLTFPIIIDASASAEVVVGGYTELKAYLSSCVSPESQHK